MTEKCLLETVRFTAWIVAVMQLLTNVKHILVANTVFHFLLKYSVLLVHVLAMFSHRSMKARIAIVNVR